MTEGPQTVHSSRSHLKQESAATGYAHARSAAVWAAGQLCGEEDVGILWFSNITFHLKKNFYRQFLPSIAQVLQPLTDLLRGNPKVLAWSAEAAAAYIAAKAALVSVVPLSHPAPGAPISLAVDASDSHVGGVLQQFQQKGWSPLAFFS